MTDGLCGTRIHLRFPSVGATENVILAAIYGGLPVKLARTGNCRTLQFREKGAKDRREGTSYPGRKLTIWGQHHADAGSDRGRHLSVCSGSDQSEICLEGMRPSDMESSWISGGWCDAKNREDGFYLDGRK